MSEAKVTRRAKVLLPIVLLVVLPMAVFVAVEGGSSLLLLARDLVGALRPVSVEGTNTEYDPELGWRAKRSFAAPDMYGPGIGLFTNDRGFRGRAAVSDSLPVGKERVVCSGDSFTLGHGVSDDQTWCELLARPDLETVNMGQVGYGLDQAYLAYLRDAKSLEHTVHIFAFVTDDFRRMALDRFLGYSKPILAVQGDSLVVSGVPTVRRGNVQRNTRLRRALQALRASELLERLGGGKAPPMADRSVKLTAAQVRAVTARLVATLAQANAAQRSRLVLAYLPIERDHVNDASREWREHMRTIADSLGVTFIDLIPALRKLDYAEAQRLYIQQSGAVFEGMGHFTVEGNRWAAQLMSAVLDSTGIVRSARRPNE